MKMQRIFLSVSGHLKTVPMNSFVYDTLKELGYEVKLFNLSADTFYQKIIKKLSKNNFYNKMNIKLISEIEIFKPDIFLTIFGSDIEDETLKIIQSMNIHTACWWLNDPFQFSRSLRQAGKYNFYFTNALGSVEEYKKENYGLIKEIKNAGGINEQNLASFEKKGLKLPATLDYFIRIGGKFTGRPTVFPKFRMFTMPWILIVAEIKEPFKYL